MNLLSGLLLFLSLVLTLVSYFFSKELFIFAGVSSWLSFLLLYITIKKRVLLNLLLLLSFFVFSYSFFNDYKINLEKVFTVNQYLLSLLIAVGFLRLVSTPKTSKIKNLPQGENSFIKTYLGVHLFGSVINLSSLILVADKMYKYGNLSKLQVILLTRAFSSDAYWSPFFVAFAAASTYAPNLEASTIIPLGMLLALFSFSFTYLEITNKLKYDLKEFRGYPVDFETLYIPIILALLVIITKYFYEDLKVIVLISLFSIIITISLILIKKGFTKAFNEIYSHIENDLPLMKMELGLFLVAGMFGVSISSILVGYEVSFPFSTFNSFSASFLLLIFILLSFVGIHPIISIAVIGNWVDNFNHTLLAMTFLMAWATAVSTSPFSGLNLTIQARYNLKALDLLKLNSIYALKMYCIGVVILHLLGFILEV